MTAPAPRQHPSEATDLALYAVAGGVVLVGLLWLAGAASAGLSGHPVPHSDPLAGLGAFAHPGEPNRAWHAPVGPAVLYWTLTVAMLLFVVVVLRLVRRDRRRDRDDPTRIEGLADLHQVRAAAGEAALLARAAMLRPSLARPGPIEDGYLLGTSHGVACWSSVEDSMVLLGPPRSGKGYHLVIPMLLDRTGTDPSSTPPPSARSPSVTACSCCARPVRSCSPSTPGPPGPTPRPPPHGRGPPSPRQ